MQRTVPINVPTDMIHAISRFLDLKSLAAFYSVNRQLYHLSKMQNQRWVLDHKKSLEKAAPLNEEERQQIALSSTANISKKLEIAKIPYQATMAEREEALRDTITFRDTVCAGGTSGMNYACAYIMGGAFGMIGAVLLLVLLGVPLWLYISAMVLFIPAGILGVGYVIPLAFVKLRQAIRIYNDPEHQQARAALALLDRPVSSPSASSEITFHLSVGAAKEVVIDVHPALTETTPLVNSLHRVTY